MKANLRLKSSLSAGIIVVGLISCAPPVKDGRPSSKIKFAHTEGWEGATMLAIRPESTLYVCDKGTGATADIIRAVEEWAAAGGMKGHIKLAEGCGHQNEITAVVEACQAAAITSHWGEEGKWKLSYCSQGYTQNYDITLHEVGHMYGQCDRYSQGSLGHPVRGESCSDQGRGSDGNYEIPSAMQAGGPAHPHRVTEDDRNGVLALIQRTDVVGSAAWRAVAGQPPGNGPIPTPSGSNTPNTLSNNGSTGNNSNTGPNPPYQTSTNPPPSTGYPSGPQPSGCSQFFNQIFQQCDSNGICRILKNVMCGSSTSQ